MSYTLSKYRAHDSSVKNHFKTIVGLPGERFYKCDIEVPYDTMKVPEGTTAVIWITTMYTSKEPGGWQTAGYYCCLGEDGFRVKSLVDTEKISNGVDAWLNEIRTN